MAEDKFREEFRVDLSSDQQFRAFRQILGHIRKSISTERMCEFIEGYARDLYYPSHDALEKLLKPSVKSYKTKFRDHPVMMVYFIGRISQERAQVFEGLDPAAEPFRKFCLQYYERFSADPHFKERYLHSQVPLKETATRGFRPAMQMLGAINRMRMDDDAVFEASRAVFRNTDSEVAPPKKYFLTYRYGAKVGTVDKSLTVLELSGRILTFENVLYEGGGRGNPRETRGFGVRAANKLYLIGGNDSALKFMAFSAFAPEAATISGMLMSIGESGDLICSRVVLRATDSAKPAGLGQKPESELASEIADFRDMLGNRVDFGMNRSVMYNGRKINQAAMVRQVSFALRSPDGEPLFTFDDGEEFNPADSAHYTYNSALREYKG